jgi:hypothetical protein
MTAAGVAGEIPVCSACANCGYSPVSASIRRTPMSLPGLSGARRSLTQSQGLDCQMLDWYCEYVRNITVSLDDEIYRQARMIAAERDTSISALVKEFLLALGSGGSHVERLKREERALRERITSFRASDKLSRDELHDRRL